MASSTGYKLDKNRSTKVCMMIQILSVNQIRIYTLIYLILGNILFLAVVVIITKTETSVMKTVFSTKDMTTITKLKHFLLT
jgi:hypothetical protein